MVVFSFFIAFSGPRNLTADECDTIEPISILCHCTLLGACKASGTGSICAQSEPGGNIFCDQYNGNC